MDDNLKLRVVDEKGDMLLTSSPQAPLFKDFSLGLGYADPSGEESHHACVVTGYTADDRLIVMTEFLGILDDVLKECVDLKDRFLINRLWLDPRDKALLRMVHEIDGLTRYANYGLDPFGNPIWKTHSTKFPYFRNRCQILYAAGVSPVILTSPTGGLDEVVGKIKRGELSLHKDCSQCDWILSQQTVSDVIKRSLAKALVYSVQGVSSLDLDAKYKPVKVVNPYPNLVG